MRTTRHFIFHDWRTDSDRKRTNARGSFFQWRLLGSNQLKSHSSDSLWGSKSTHVFQSNVSKSRMHVSRSIHSKCIFPQGGQFCHTGIWTRIRASEQQQKLCEHEQVNTRLIFASNSSNGRILRALSNWMGPFDTPIRPSSSSTITS